MYTITFLFIKCIEFSLFLVQTYTRKQLLSTLIDENSLQVSLLKADDRSSLFVSFRKPHNVVTSKTLSRWVCSLLADAGVDTTLFQSHATRSAAGAFLSNSLSSIQLCKIADWSSTSGTYEKFYQRYL